MRLPLATLLLALPLVSCARHSTVREVDETLSAGATGTAAERARRFLRLVADLRAARAGVDDQVVAYGFARMEDYYRGTRDGTLLDVLDAAPASGFYASELCDFYEGVLELPEARRRYRERGVDALRRCVGRSLSERDLQALR